MKSAEIICRELNALLAAHASPENAGPMEAYMKHHFSFYGVKSPQRRVLFSEYWKEHKTDIQFAFRNTVRSLWQEEHRECQYLAMEILNRNKKQLKRGDFSLVEACIVSRSWWDTVDFLASNIIGHMLREDIELRQFKVAEYLSSENMWLQRSALLFQLKYGDRTDELLLFETIKALLDRDEFFINKAIGWALRQYSKTEPHKVRAFVTQYKDRMATVSLREAAKYI